MRVVLHCFLQAEGSSASKAELETTCQKNKKFQDDLAAKEEEITKLENARQGVLSLLDNLQRKMLSYDELYKAKNREISEAKQLNDEQKMVLDEATEELEDLKSVEKDNKELARKLKTAEKEKVKVC